MENFFEDRKAKIDQYNKEIRRKRISTLKVEIPAGLFTKCEKCLEPILSEDIINNDFICPNCQYHFRISAQNRIKMIVDKGSFNELFDNIKTLNPLDFPNYLEKVKKYQDETKELDAFICGVGQVKGINVAIGSLDSFFMMGSMGSVVGEKVTRLVEYATYQSLPLIIISASGGARMQEGIFSLMQMAKTAAAIKYHHLAGLFYLSILTNPTTGGVAASFASLGDIIIAEQEALIGFAGQRVIKQTINEELPDNFQTAEFQLEHGFIDKIVNRKNLKETIYLLLKIHERGN